jgi:predicted Zn-dependent protease with MMP-like domain
MTIRLSEEEFEELVDQALESLPENFLPYMENLSVEVMPLPSRDLMRERKVTGPRTGLLGLYHGVPLTQKSVWAPFEWPEQIFIFQRNIEAICDSREEIVAQVRQTVLHEVGHHFGMNEEDLRKLGYG